MDHVAREYIYQVKQRVSEDMFGLDRVLDLLLIALYTNGHVLLEGNPGMGKTTLVKTLCQALGFYQKRWGRIQFTPDLMPSDITGSLMPDEEKPTRFVFRHGPIFRWLLLADEINRATPKTQSAMLEAMGERQVTYAGTTYKLGCVTEEVDSAVAPFMVMATQNPIDEEGTFQLPKAQADRFMFKIRMPNLTLEMLQSILQKDAGNLSKSDNDNTVSDNKFHSTNETEMRALQQYTEIRKLIFNNRPQPIVEKHICNLVLASNAGATVSRTGWEKRTFDISTKRLHELSEMVKIYFVFGLSPRAATAMMLGAKAWAVLFSGRDGEDTVTGFANVVLPIIRHRIYLSLDWDVEYRKRISNSALSDADLLDHLLAEFILATSPNDSNYQSLLIQSLKTQGYLAI
jgi:MoxR-like ATPase